MDCKTTINQIGEYLDNELSASDSAVVKRHLAECESCSDLYNGQKLLDQSLRTGVRDTPVSTTALRERIHQKLPARRSVFTLTPLRWVGLTIALVAVIAVAMIGLQRFRSAPASNTVLYADLVEDYLDHGRPPGLVVGVDDSRLERQLIRYKGVDRVMDHFRAENYTLIHSQACLLDKTNFLHLIYQKDGKYLSVFFTPGESALVNGVPSQRIGKVSVHEWTEQGYPLAALQGANCVVLLIGEYPNTELRQVAGTTAPSLPVGAILP